MKRRTLQKVNPSIVATQSHPPTKGITSKRENTCCQVSSLSVIRWAIKMCGKISIAHLHFFEKRDFKASDRLCALKPQISIENSSKFPCWPVGHFFSPLYINFNIFFSHLSEEKKWESGQKTRKPLGRNGFSLATFENKSGQKVGKWPIFHHFQSFFRARI